MAAGGSVTHWLEALRGGDREAAQKMWERYYQRLVGLARQRLRESALRNQPWTHATGPRTPAGKARSAANAKKRQTGPRSVREIKRDLADLRGLLADMRANRQMVDTAYSEGR
jgi:hypothetical protein